jgi:hypothetical protein
MHYIRLVLACSALAIVSTHAAAQIPEKFENLRVLPDPISQRELLDVMGGFTRALGVRCNYCHVGEEGRPLSTYDFPADDKFTKRKARVMYRMVQAINGQFLDSLEHRTSPVVRVQCVTCHAGRTVPRELEDILLMAHDSGGLDSTIATYRALREQYYGRAAYDFGSVPLTVVAAQVGQRGAVGDATALLALNVEMNPTSVFAKRQHGRSAVFQAFLEGGADSGLARYRALRAAYGADAFPEFMLNSLGYLLLRGQKVPESIVVFRLVVDSFPDSANAYDSLGEAYAAAGDVPRAIANYERSLALNPGNDNAKQRLQELRARR